MSGLFTSGGQSIGASASVYMLPLSVQSWFSLGLTCLISLPSKVISRVFSLHHNTKPSILQHSAFFMIQLSHLYMITGKKEMATYSNTPGKFHGWRSLVGYSPWGRKQLDMTERLDFTSQGRPELWLHGPLLAKWYLCFYFYFVFFSLLFNML